MVDTAEQVYISSLALLKVSRSLYLNSVKDPDNCNHYNTTFSKFNKYMIYVVIQIMTKYSHKMEAKPLVK